ncbi:signal peptidase I [Spirosoma foliorum]|uniref:Signal peptidase I n=1 Tax=Spirosoma foliorum TaxID=2710596 RepID=A0A7G5GQM1_9BACT|nr:signal peptidase I [Spirosoma foliorum]QMW01163.1 signal peptidase I [Spirosoma foliorum]
MSEVKTRAEEKPAKAKKSPIREWLDSVLFAVVAATLIRWLFMEAFTIPTPSMENSLMVGDFLFVSKLHYGTRTPRTPLQVPLTHQKIWGTDIPSYSTAIQLPSYRLPGFTHVKNGDVVVFNVPPKYLNDNIDYPVDLKTNYIKRCIGIPGDVLEVRQREVFVNGKPFPTPPRSEQKYFIKTTESLDANFFRKYDIVNDYRDPSQPTENWKPLEQYNDSTKTSVMVGYSINTTKEVIDKFKGFDWVKGIEPMSEKPGEMAPMIYGTPTFKWNHDNFGPITIPKKGVTIQINAQTIALYGPVIQLYEGNDKVEVEPASIKIDGKTITSYTFKQDYYFMMGDNRDNSLDSRFWGFVPEDHIVGKAVFVWMSLDPNPANIWNKIRWNRLFRTID